MGPGKETIIDIKNLTVEFDTDDKVIHAVNHVDLEIHKGEVIGLVGESGSGKTVTAQSIVRLVPTPPARYVSGEIFFKGEDILTMPIETLRPIRGASISMIFQEPMTALSPLHKVGNQMVECLQLHREVPTEEAWQIGEEWLNKVGLTEVKTRMLSYPHELSGGMRQRVMIAMALMLEPDLIIADEPTTALDVTVQKQIFKLLMSMKHADLSLLLITHDMAVVWELSDRIYIMKEGEIVESGEVERVYSAPRHDYTKKLLKAVPRLYEEGEISVMRSAKAVKHDMSGLDHPLIRVKDLDVWFPIKRGFMARTVDYVKAVNKVSLEITQGKTLGLVGESGSGKTTLGRAIIGLEHSDHGEVFYKGEKINHLSKRQLFPYRRNMQMIFQDPYSSLNPRMTILDILTEGVVEHKLLEGTKKDKAAEVLEDVGLTPDMMNRYPFEFSGGQRQRISVARALSLAPEFIVCDEAVSALDVSIQAQIIDLLIDIQKKYNMTYLFISHDLSVVRRISDHIAVMYHGEIIEYGEADEVVLQPTQEYTRSLLDAVPIPGNMQKRMEMRGES